MILAGGGGRRTELVSRFAIRSMGMKNRKKNSDRIRNPFVARPCEVVVVVSGDAACYYCYRYSRRRLTTTPWSQAKQARSMAWVMSENRAVMYPAIKTTIASNLCFVFRQPSHRGGAGR